MRYLLYCLVALYPLISITKEPIKVAIIDTGLNLTDIRFKSHLCSSGHKDFTNESIKDFYGHGTHVTGLIYKYAENSDYCVIIIKYFSEKLSGMQNQENMVLSIEWAIKQKAKIVNISSGGNSFDLYEYSLLKDNPQVIFSVSAGNDNRNLEDSEYKFYPASYGLPNIHVVGNLNRTKSKASMSNYGSLVKYWEIGVDIDSTLPDGQHGELSGTSMSAAIHTGKLIRGVK